MHTFFIPELAADLVDLPDEEAAHALRVLRLRDGERVVITNGRGTRAEAVLRIFAAKRVRAEVIARKETPPERKGTIHLAVAMTKQAERFEWMLEKCVEIGVDRLTPLITARTERSKLRADRLEKIMIAAMKQSQRAWLPALDDPKRIDELLVLQDRPAQCSFGWCEGERAELAKAYHGDKSALLLIGPEGDFTAGEAALLRSKDFAAVSLGEARLRTETAAIVACTWMNLAQSAT